MKKLATVLGVIGVLGIVVNFWLFATPSVSAVEIPNSADAIERGEYLFIAGGCISCHKGDQDPDVPSGGFALETDFGTFYAPNITPDNDTGIGAWSGQDFISAMKHGRSPDGSFYYPAFPYRSYAGLSDNDVLVNQLHPDAANLTSAHSHKPCDPVPDCFPW